MTFTYLLSNKYNGFIILRTILVKLCVIKYFMRAYAGNSFLFQFLKKNILTNAAYI